MRHSRLGCMAAFLLSACAAPDHPADRPSIDSGGDRVHAFAASRAIQDEWWHAQIRGETSYELVALGNDVAIRATGQESASGLYRRLQIDPRRCPVFEWSWAVGQLQESADLRRKDADDVAASIFLLFGDPGMLSNPAPVPTLRYVWTSGNAIPGEVIPNPYMPGVVRNLVVRSDMAPSGGFVAERRNVVDDFRAAFGEQPTPDIEAIALFTDNDQTKEPVVSHYGSGRFLCNN